MFDNSKLSKHQDFIFWQETRKRQLGKLGYADRKFWEEMEELRFEIVESQKNKELTENFINEVGDFLFCLLGEEKLADALIARLQFDKERAERYKQLDQDEIEKGR